MRCSDATSINNLGWDLPVSASECSTTWCCDVHMHSRWSSSRTKTSFSFGFLFTYSTFATWKGGKEKVSQVPWHHYSSCLCPQWMLMLFAPCANINKRSTVTDETFINRLIEKRQASLWLALFEVWRQHSSEADALTSAHCVLYGLLIRCVNTEWPCQSNCEQWERRDGG